MPPKFLEHIVILWLERRYLKQNSVIHLKLNISPKYLGWLDQWTCLSKHQTLSLH